MHEEVLDHQEIELAERLFGVVEVGLREQRVLADDVHGARLAAEAPLDHLRHDTADASGRSHAPRRLEARERGGVVVRIAREVRRNAAGVAAALDVVLAAERRDAAAREAHLAGDEGKVEQRVGVVDPVRVLGDAHAPDQT